MDLTSRLFKANSLEHTSILSESKIFTEKEHIRTPVPMINVALSGRVDGGLTRGLTVLAGPSKHFKTSFALLLAGSFLRARPNGKIIFFDSEFGSPAEYFKSFGVDPDKVVHVPIVDINQLKHQITKFLNVIEKDDDVMILVDSVGNLASNKEAADALEGKDVADMTRAKHLKSVFRIVTPHLTLKDIPMVVVNHTYKELSSTPRDIVSGGTGVYYSADNIWIIGRSQDKKSGEKEVQGYDFNIKIEKSRFVFEGKRIEINVKRSGGIMMFSGLLENAIEHGSILQSGAWYSEIDLETGEVLGNKMRKNDIIKNAALWKRLLTKGTLYDFIKTKYSLPEGPIMDEDSFGFMDEDDA